MSHVTADLEYFKCDVCGTYMHKDIFCNHRRECTGLGSKELKKSECTLLEKELAKETRRLAAEREAEEYGAPASVGEGEGKNRNVFFSVEEEERRKEAAIRRSVSDEYQKQLDKEFESKILNDEKRKALLDFLME